MEKLAELSVGLAAAIGVLWIVLQMIRELRKTKPANGDNGHSGEKSPSYWQREFRLAVKEELDKFEKGRMERFEEIVNRHMQTIRDDIRNLKR